MPTSGTATWNIEISDLIEDAYERAGLEARTGYDYRTARRSLNMISAEWSNRGLNLWTVEQLSITLSPNVSTYILPADNIDVIDAIVRLSGQGTNFDYPLSRIGVTDYATLPNKSTTGRPLQIYVQKQISQSFILWPVPDQAYTILYWRLRRMQDATNAPDNMDIPVRFVPALAAALAYQIALKRPEAANRVPMLQAEYERQFALAAEEDRERSPATFVPWNYSRI
jgi:hypothetical protein